MVERTCSLEECNEAHCAQDYCAKHYQRWAKWGDPLGGGRRVERKERCAVEGCSDPWKSKDWCGKHYQRWAKYGDPLGSAPPRTSTKGLVPESGLKGCSVCGIEKPLEEFSPAKRGLYGRRSNCKRCAGKQATERYRADPDKHKAASIRWHQRNPERSRLRRRRVQLSKYGLTPESFEEMLERQGGACAICGTADPGSYSKQWPVDHDHATGALREILCQPCNCALGLANDSIERLQAMIDYLIKHRTRQLVSA